MKEVKKEEGQEWDKRKILLFLIAAVILLIVGFQIKTLTLGEDTSKPQNVISSNKSSVKGANDASKSSVNLKQDIQKQINSLKEDAENINIVDIASSSPQVQKVINDLKSLQDYPSNQIRDICEKVCRGL